MTTAYRIFSGSSHPQFAADIARELGSELAAAKCNRFPDGEISVRIEEDVRGLTTFIVQTVASDPERHLMELLLLMDALKRGGARQIIPVVPYLAYCRQDRKDAQGVSISAKLVAKLIEAAGAHWLVTMELHSSQVEGFFEIPVENLHSLVAMAQQIENENLQNLVVVAPDLGSAKVARPFATHLGTKFALVDKERLSPTQTVIHHLIGDVRGCDVLLVDDLCSTASTLIGAALAAKHAGARRVLAAVTHGLLIDPALERIATSPIEKLLIADTIPLAGKSLPKNIQPVSVAKLFADRMRSIA